MLFQGDLLFHCIAKALLTLILQERKGTAQSFEARARTGCAAPSSHRRVCCWRSVLTIGAHVSHAVVPHSSCQHNAGCPCLPAVWERSVRSATDQLTALRSRGGHGWGMPCCCSGQCTAAAAVRQHAAVAEALGPLSVGEWLAWQGQTTLLGQTMLLRGHVRCCVCQTADLDARQTASA